MSGLQKDESQQRRLLGVTFGIIGLGPIGMAVALLARTFGFKVSFYDPYLPSGTDHLAEIARAHTLEELLRGADIVSLHCPLTSETEHLIGEREIKWMKPTAFIINTAGVEIINKESVIATLQTGRLGGAGFGVTEVQAIEAFGAPEDRNVPNLFVLCHAAFARMEAKKEMRTTSTRMAIWDEAMRTC